MESKLIKDTNAYRNLKKKCNAKELALLDYIVHLDEMLSLLFKTVKNNFETIKNSSEQLSNLHDFMEMQSQLNDLFAYKLGLERDDQNGDTDSPVEGDNGRVDSAVENEGD